MSKSRKMIVVALAVASIGALVVAQAFAATTTWKGKGTNDTKLSVSFKRVGGQPPKIKDVQVDNLRFVCHNANPPIAPFRSGFSRTGTVASVHSGKFAYSATTYNSNHSIKYTTSFSGKFVSGTKATGTVKQRRTVVGSSTYCASKDEPWTAHKQ